jgi:hypothetical protein
MSKNAVKIRKFTISTDCSIHFTVLYYIKLFIMTNTSEDLTFLVYSKRSYKLNLDIHKISSTKFKDLSKIIFRLSGGNSKLFHDLFDEVGKKSVLWKFTGEAIYNRSENRDYKIGRLQYDA